jgi:DNA-binding response OmpR family regulator
MKPRTLHPITSTTTIRRQLIEHLTQAGFAVTLAHRLREALATAQHTPGLLVILDLMDPEAGAQLVEDLHAVEDGERQTVLVLSPAERLPPERQLLQ